MVTKTISGNGKGAGLIGVTGLSIWGGLLNEEYLNALKGTKRDKVFREMEDDAVIGALLDAIKMPLIRAEFNVIPASEESPDAEAADFLWDVMNGMDGYTWRQHVVDMLDFLRYGFALSEVAFKKRPDGRMGIAILEPRGQETVERWLQDGSQIIGIQQRDPVTGQLYTIESWKLIHATFRPRKRNPEGSSPLRSLYRSWYTRRNLEIIEAIGAERDLAGLPVIELPQGALQADSTTAETMVRHIRNDEEAGVVLPFGWKLNLLSGGSKSYNTREIIRDLNKTILMRFFAQFLVLGMEQAGTQALVKGSHDFFSLALESIQQELIEMWNMQLVSRLFQMNPWPGLKGLPKLDWTPPGKNDIAAISTLFRDMVGVDILTPDSGLEDYVRSMAGLPDRPEGEREGERIKQQPQSPFQIQAATKSTFAVVDGTQGRRGRGRMEQATNAYQGALLDVYDSWATATAKTLQQATDPGAVMDTELPKLAEALKQAGRKGIREAVTMGLRGAEPGPEALSLMASEITANEIVIDEKLIPDIKQRLQGFIVDNAGQPFDEKALKGTLDSQRSKPAMGAGGFWVAIFRGGAISVAEEDKQRQAEGKQKLRVRWVLDPDAEHCVTSPGFFGCPDLVGEYDSWDAMPTVPAGQVTCRGNCRCFIELETEHGWDRLA